MNKWLLLSLVAVVVFLVACSPTSSELVDGDQLNVVATTTIVGDVVSQIGGDSIHLNVLLPVGVDPHSFDPTPQDVALVSDADIIFINGAGLEAFLDKLIAGSDSQDKVVDLSSSIRLIDFSVEENHERDVEEHENEGADPHVWTDPNNVILWVDQIAKTLSELDPSNSDFYDQQKNNYTHELRVLDDWIREQVAQIPTANRKLVTDHALFGYFAHQYGFEQVGALIIGYSTLAEPTAQELAVIEDLIQNFDVNAVFVGNTVNPSLAERVAEDTGVELVYVYTGSLSKSDGQAKTYLAYMRYNTNAFVNALR